MEDRYIVVHTGVKGMHWGIRKHKDPIRRRIIRAARQFYKVDRLQRRQDKTDNFGSYRRLDKRIRKVNTRRTRNEARLTKKQINAGREAVAKARVKRNIALSAVTTPVAASVGALLAGPVGATVLGGTTMLTSHVGGKTMYYAKNAKAYGSNAE